MFEIKSKESFFEVINSTDSVVVDFYADWCGPCKAQEPILKEYEKSTGTPVVKVNVDTQPELSGSLNIMSIPTAILFENGEPKGVKIGAGDLNFDDLT